MLKYDEEAIITWSESDVIPAIATARESEDWKGLLSRNWKDDDHFNSFRSFHGEGTVPWQTALVRRGLITEAESKLISLASRQVKATNATLYSDEQLEAWVEQTVKPAVSQAVAEEDWAALAPSSWSSDSHYPIATARLAGRARNWYGLLENHCGVSSEQVSLIRAAVKREAAADFIAPKFTDEEIDTWVDETLKPVLDRARRENQWHLLRRADWNSDPHCNSAVRRFGGSWDLVLSDGLGLDEGDIAKVKEGSKEVQFRNLAAVRLEKSNGEGNTRENPDLAEVIERKENEFRNLLSAAVAEAREAGNWTGLTLGSLDPEGELVTAGMALTQITALRKQGLNGWYSVIERYGELESQELEAVREAALEEKRRKLSEAHRRFSQDELDQWVDESVKPVVEEARTTGNWALVMKKNWDDHPQQTTLCGMHGTHDSDWYSVLSHYQLVSDEEIELARQAAQTERTRVGGAKHRKFSEEELTTWFGEQIQTRIVAARIGGDWGELMLAAWRGDPHFSTINQVFGKSNNDWYGVLVRLGGVTPAEESLIRQEGELARTRKRETPQLHDHKYERSSKAKRQIVVVERLVLGDGPRHETNFRTIIERFHETGSSNVSCQPVSNPEKTRAVLEVTGAELLREHLSPADQLRLLFSRLRTQSDWSAMATTYQDILPALSSFLANRAALLFVSNLAGTSSVVPFPRKVLSVGAGTGDLYDAAEELESMLTSFGQERPEVTDLDFSQAMLRLSRNPEKIHAPATAIPIEDESFDMVECSSPYRLGSSAELGNVLSELHRVVKPGGLLWLKADGVLFSDSFIANLERLGFDLIAPPNGTLSLPSEVVRDLDPKLRQRSLAALKNTHFIFARKTSREAQNLIAEELTFARKRTVSEDVEEVQGLLKGLLRSSTDMEYIINARTFVETMSTLAPETFHHKGALSVGLLHKYLGVLFDKNEVGTLPRERDVVSLHEKLTEHQRLINGNLFEMEGLDEDPDSIILYLREMKRAVDHLEELAR